MLGLALLLVVLLILGRPFLIHPHDTVRQRKGKKSLRLLRREKDEILEAIRDLEFDHDTGKIPTEVYEPQRAHLTAQAAERLKAIDQLKSRRKQTRPSIDNEIEAAIAQLRVQPAPAQKAPAATNGHAKFCPECGQPVDAGDKFCTACGQPLRTTQPA